MSCALAPSVFARQSGGEESEDFLHFLACMTVEAGDQVILLKIKRLNEARQWILRALLLDAMTPKLRSSITSHVSHKNSMCEKCIKSSTYATAPSLNAHEVVQYTCLRLCNALRLSSSISTSCHDILIAVVLECMNASRDRVILEIHLVREVIFNSLPFGAPGDVYEFFRQSQSAICVTYKSNQIFYTLCLCFERVVWALQTIRSQEPQDRIVGCRAVWWQQGGFEMPLLYHVGQALQCLICRKPKMIRDPARLGVQHTSSAYP